MWHCPRCRRVYATRFPPGCMVCKTMLVAPELVERVAFLLANPPSVPADRVPLYYTPNPNNYWKLVPIFER